MKVLAVSKNCTYTRYADDLTFSTNESAFPSLIAGRAPEHPHLWTAGAGLAKRTAKAGFVLNAQKTRMQYCDSRQEATGLVVNEKVNVRAEYYKLARSMCWQLFEEGEAYERINDVATKLDPNKLRGMLAFIYHVKRWDDARRNARPRLPIPVARIPDRLA